MYNISKDFLKSVTEKHDVSKAELNALELALSGKTSEEISENLGISAAAVRKRLGSVYSKFNITGNAPGKIEVLRTELLKKYQSSQTTNIQQHQDWGDAVKSNFYGREEESDNLEKWITEENCKLIAVLGMGGIGKTALSITVAENVEKKFDCLIWRSLKNAPPLAEILEDILRKLSEFFPDEEKAIPENSINRARFLIDEYLKKQRCLIVLDNLESILQEEDSVGHYKKEHEDYGKFIELVGEKSHNSCVIFTSREKPKEIELLEDRKTVRSLTLGSLKEAGKKIFKAKGFSESENKEWGRLIDHYGGNPLSLTIAATTIQELYNGDVEQFLTEGTEVFGDIKKLLEEQFKRLTKLEKDVMYWLAIERELVTISQLKENLAISPLKSELFGAIKSLKQRSLIEVKESNASFTLHNVVIEYLYDQLIEEISQEIKKGTETSGYLNSYALLKATAKDYVRKAQTQLILKPIKERLLIQQGRNRIEQRCKEILSSIKGSKESLLLPGYAAGNILNLLCLLKSELKGWDFSHLDIRQAYLQNVNLHEVNFTRSKFSQTVFKKIFGGILSIAFHPDGRTIAAGDTNGKIIVWDIESGELKKDLPSDNLMRSLTFSPDGTTLAHTGENQIITIWKQDENGEWNFFKSLNDENNQVWSVAYSPDSKTIVSGGEDGKLKIWSIDSGECIDTLTGHKECVRSVAYHPNQKIIASGSEDNKVKVWDVATGKCLKPIEGHTDWVRAVAFSPNDGKYLATASEDNTIKIWQFVDNEYKWVQNLEEHKNWVWSVSFSLDGKYLASGSADTTIKIWNVTTGKCINTLYDHNNWVQSVAFNPKDNGKTLASGSTDRTVRVWDVNSGKCIQTILGHSTWMRTIAFSPDCKTIVGGSEDRTVKIWNIATGKCLEPLEGHTNWVHSVACSSDGRYIASCSPDRTIIIWRVIDSNKYEKYREILLEENRDKKDSKGHWARTLIFSPDSQTIISGNEDNTIKIWDINSGECLDNLEEHKNWVSSLALDSEKNCLISASTDKTIIIWQKDDNGKYQPRQTLEGHENWINSVTFNSERRIIASGSEDKTIVIWQEDANGEYQPLPPLIEHKEAVRSVAFNSDPESPILASGSKDRTIKLWKYIDDNKKWECFDTLEGHKNWVSSVVFCSDNKTIASTSMDETIRLWDVNTRKCIGEPLRSDPPYNKMNITKVDGLSDVQKKTLKTLGAVED